MALIVGDEVAVFVSATNSVYAERNGDFQFGVVATTDVDVIWANGTFAENVPAAALDKIVPGVSLGNGAGEVVAIGDGFSAEYQGIVLREYSRQPAGTGSIENYMLVQLLSTGRLVEVLRASVTIVPGR